MTFAAASLRLPLVRMLAELDMQYARLDGAFTLPVIYAVTNGAHFT
jgi:hypothetical protein